LSRERLELLPGLAALWPEAERFDAILDLHGEAVRTVAERSTIRVELAGRTYYIKRHYGVGWVEIFKNLLTLKRPVLDAGNEYRAIEELSAAGVHTLSVAGFGIRGHNPARRQSFLITEELASIDSLEAVCLRWPENPPRPRDKRVLIERVAEIARRMHALGFVHQDFYICHFLLGGSGTEDAQRFVASPICLVDLHRAHRYKNIPERWLIKDLAGLYFSTLDICLTRRDVLRFLRIYFDRPLRQVFDHHRQMLGRCEVRARRLYNKARRKKILPRQLAGIER
jgi:heptose I phosphotransferase